VTSVIIAETGTRISSGDIVSEVRYKISLHLKMMPNYSVEYNGDGFEAKVVNDVYFVFE
jgi:hypothetical protein